jgi:hypothetical protein
MTAKSRGIMHSTGRRKPILMSGAGKAVGGILRRRPCSFLAYRIAGLPLNQLP